MGIWLYTGLPGAGKTLCVVKEIIENILKPDAEGNVPPVYAHIDGFEYEKLGVKRLAPEHVETQEEAIRYCREWYKVEAGSYVVIDECQRCFPVRNSAAAVPIYVSEFETHRHLGLNIILITQGPNLIDKHVRTLVERHVHLKRTFGLHRSLRVEWPQCEENPQSSFAISRGVTSSFKFPAKYFNFYKSATIHNHQRRVPWKLLLMALMWFVLAVSGFAYYIYSLNAKHSRGSETLIEKSADQSTQITLKKPVIQCSVTYSGSLSGTLFFIDNNSGVEFSLPEHVELLREPEGHFLFNLHTGSKYLICNS